MSNLRDTLIYDDKQIANETISNSLIYYGIAVLGLDEMVFNAGDGQIISSVKSGLVASAVNVAGSLLRQYVPMLNVFDTS